MTYRIALVEDDQIIAKEVVRSLESWGYESLAVQDFSRVLEEVMAFRPSLILLDITLPYFDGYHWCRKIRERSEVPIVFLSSASDKLNIVMAMNMGADDFITKPFSMDILVAKIQAVLRRSYHLQPLQETLEVDGLILDLDRMTLQDGDQCLELSKNEFKILETLMRHVDRPVSRNKLIESLWASDAYVDDNTLTVNVARLRNKLKRIGRQDFVQTKVGVGYYVKSQSC